MYLYNAPLIYSLNDKHLGVLKIISSIPIFSVSLSKCMHHSLRDGTSPAEGYSDETATANKCITAASKIM